MAIDPEELKARRRKTEEQFQAIQKYFDEQDALENEVETKEIDSKTNRIGISTLRSNPHE